MSRVFSFAIVAIAIVIAGFFVRSGLVAFKLMGSTVEVRGLAERKVLSDYGQWTPRFRIVANTMKDVQAEYVKLKNLVEPFLQERGFAKEEITFLPMLVEDLASNAYTTQQYRYRYSVSIPVVVTTSDVKKLDTTVQDLSYLYDKGANIYTSSLQYEYTKLNEIKPEMLKEATENARISAETFTKDSKTTLGKLKEASQGLFSITSEYGSYEAPSMYKNVRVVTRATYLLE